MDNNNKIMKVSKRYLPHWEYPGSTYFITFSVIQGYELDGIGKEITFNAIKYHAGKKYVLLACIVMSTHVHIIISPLEGSEGTFFSISEIMHSIKSYSANKIQKTCQKNGNIWLEERYDRIIRNDNELFEEMSYIINNPVKAGLVKNPEDYKWLYYKS